MALTDASPRLILDAWGVVNIPNGTHSTIKIGCPVTFDSAVVRHVDADENVFTLYALEDADLSAVFSAAVGAVITGFVGGTAGNPLYIGAAGTYTETSTSADICGYMVTATTAIVGPSTLPV